MGPTYYYPTTLIMWRQRGRVVRVPDLTSGVPGLAQAGVQLLGHACK